MDDDIAHRQKERNRTDCELGVHHVQMVTQASNIVDRAWQTSTYNAGSCIVSTSEPSEGHSTHCTGPGSADVAAAEHDVSKASVVPVPHRQHTAPHAHYDLFAVICHERHC